MKRLLFTLLVCAIPALAAGTVTSSISSIGPTVSVLQFNWTGDAVNGSVPSTAAVSLLSVQGYYISNVQIRPLTPAPTSGYAVTVTDGRGADILSGLGGSLSASATANFAPSSAVPPLVGSLTINLTGNAVASAQGQVLVYFTKPGTVNLGIVNQQSSGTSNSGRLGYTYTAESFGAAGTCASDDTAFIQAGINALQGTGAPLWLSGCYKTTSALNVSSAGNITFDGGGTIKPYVSGAAYNALQILGYNGTSTTVTTNISLANRAFPSTNVVGVTSVGAFSVGGYVFMNYNDGTYTFGQVSQVQGIAGNNLTLVDPLYIPMTSGVTTITPLVMSPSVKVKNLTFDGSNFSPNAYSFALETGNTVDLDMEGLTYKNFSQTAFAAATYITVGYKTISNRERVYNSGSVGYDQLNYVYQSNMEGSNIIASNGPASTGACGIGLSFVINSSFSNIQSMGSYSREMKLLGCGYNNFTNINLGNSPHATLLSIAVGSYRNRFHNVVTVYAPTGIGVWFSDQSKLSTASRRSVATPTTTFPSVSRTPTIP